MSKPVTEEMISALIDGELSPADRVLVENAISADESLRRIYEGFQESATALKESAEWVGSAVSLPVDFTSRVMSEIETGSTEGQVANHSASSENSEKENRSVVTPASTQSPVWTVRTLVEIVAAVAAVIVIAVVWQGQGNNHGSNGETAKQDVNQQDVEGRKPKNGVRALGSKDGNFKSNTSKEKGEEKDPGAGPVSSRKFSVFIKASTRPLIDRFWILNNYEVTAPEGTDPGGNNSQVNVLLIDAKKKDAVDFFSQLKKWDSGFQVFQQAKTGNASWLAPFDVSRADQSEGDFWTLQIVLIK